MMLLDRAIRGTLPAPPVPIRELGASARSVVQRIASGALDDSLAGLRWAEIRGQHRPSVVEAIDARARQIAEG